MQKKVLRGVREEDNQSTNSWDRQLRYCEFIAQHVSVRPLMNVESQQCRFDVFKVVYDGLTNYVVAVRGITAMASLLPLSTLFDSKLDCPR